MTDAHHMGTALLLPIILISAQLGASIKNEEAGATVFAAVLLSFTVLIAWAGLTT